MSLPFSSRKNSDASKPGTTSTGRLSTSHSSNRPISTSSRGYSVISKESLPEKQLLSRYRHVYAGKGGWFQGRSGTANNANFTSGANSRHLDVYRKELIMKLSKDIFENSKQKLATADYVVSNKVAGDPDNDVHNVTTKLGEPSTRQMTTVEETQISSPRLSSRGGESGCPKIGGKPGASKFPMKPVFHSLNMKTPQQIRTATSTVADQRKQSANKTPIRINLRGGSSKVEHLSSSRGLNPTAAVGYKPSTTKPMNDNIINSNITPGNVNANHNKPIEHSIDKDTLSTEQRDTARQSEQEPVTKKVKSLAQNEDQLNNDIPEDVLFSALKRSKTIHIASLRTAKESSHVNDTEPQEKSDNDNTQGNEAKRINDGLNASQQSGIQNDKSVSDRELKNSKSGRKNVENSVDQKKQHPQISNSVKRPHDACNQTQDKSSNTHKKSAKKDRNSKSKLLDKDVNEILGEIHFNVLRQRSFIRIPKNVSNALPSGRNNADAEENENGISRQLLSRMSLSKEARDALQETRLEMRRDSIIHMEQLDSHMKTSTPVQKDQPGKRPNSPKPQSSQCDTHSTRSSSDHGSRSSTSRQNNGPPGVNSDNQSFDDVDGSKQNRFKKNGKKYTIPNRVGQHPVTNTSKDKFNHVVEHGHLSSRKHTRESTVSTPIIDLVSPIPNNKQDGYIRYSTNMTKDNASQNQTPRGQATRTVPNNRNLSRKISTGSQLPNTKTHQHITAPMDVTGGLQTGNNNSNGQNKRSKNSYKIPLKASAEDIEIGDRPLINVNGVPLDDASVKSDWESQLRAMSKYGLVTEKSFQITPPGWDQRYNDLAKRNSKAEPESKDVEITLAQVKEKAVEKCSDWLQRYG